MLGILKGRKGGNAKQPQIERTAFIEAPERNGSASAQQPGPGSRLLEKSTLRQRGRKRKAKETAPKTSTQFIGYERMFEDGVCEVAKGVYSRAFKFSDINYQTARRDEQIDLFTRYCEALNACDPSVHLQINVINRHIDEQNFKDTMFIPMHGDALDHYRKEMNAMLAAKALEGQNSTVCEKYAIFSTAAPDYETAVPTLSRLEGDLSGHFKSIGCDIHEMNGTERLEMLHNMFRPNERFDFQYGKLLESNLTTKAYIAPPFFDFTPRDFFSFGNHYGQVLVLRDLPADMPDKVISELSRLPMSMNITLHISNMDQAEALDMVRRQIAMMEMEVTDVQQKAVRSNNDPELAVPMETRRSHKEAYKLLDLLENKNQRLFKLTMLIYTYANDLDTLRSNVLQIMATARQNSVELVPLDLRQREGLNSVIPVGSNLVPIERTLPTAATAIFIPFTAVELYQQGGMYYGLNAVTHNLIFLNRYALRAQNGIILGTPGSGKSFAAKREMINVLLNDPNAEVVIIDPEREYSMLAASFGGEIVHISAGSKTHINPMDCSMDYADAEDPLQLKAEFILTICELLVGGKAGLSGGQRSIISRACKLCYGPFFANSGRIKPPTLKDFYEVVKKQPEAEAQSLALDLELYIEGTLDAFAHETNVDIKKRLVVYDVMDLGKQLRTFGMIVVLDQIWNRITTNRAAGKRTWIYIDEFQLLLSNEYSANYFFELWSRARKWGAVPTGITQNVETLLLSDLARRMLSNSDFIMMLNQATSDRVELAGLLNISNRQLQYITSSKAGHGLLFAGKSIVPFIDEFPKDTELYKMMSTKIEEVTEQPAAADTEENEMEAGSV